jgi:hypothetical protein
MVPVTHDPPPVPEDRETTVNVMYSQLLEAVLADEEDPEARPRSQGPLADVMRLRHAMDRRAAQADGDPGWAMQAVADQLAYDAALIRLARRRGIPTDPARFENPGQGRAEVEDALVAIGVDLPRPTAQDPGTAPGPTA